MSGNRTESSVIAIVHDGDRLRAVEVQKGLAGLQVAWAKSSPPGQLDWAQFATECGLAVGRSHGAKDQTRPQVALGLAPVGVAFYRMRLPAVPDSETDAMIRMQAETRLPLPADQMELAWRIGDRGAEQMTVTLAAIRRRQAQSLVDQVRPLAPDRLVLSSEALVGAWTALFADSAQGDAVVISLNGRSTQVCLVEAGMLGHVAVIEMGADDLVGDRLGIPSERPGQAGGQTEVEEQFIQDVKSVMEGLPRPGQPVVVLSDGSPLAEYVAGLLRGAGLQTTVATAKARTIQAAFSPGQWYEYKTAIGLALMVFGAPQSSLDLFTNLYKPPGQEQAHSPILSPRTAAGVAAVALVGAMAISYFTDVALADRLRGLMKEHKVVELKAQRDAKENVARYRPDILALLQEVNSGSNEGIVLDSLHFKRGQAVQIVGQADRPEQLYKFEKALIEKSGIRDVKIEKSVKDNKGDKVKFTMTFQYKSFTQKSARF